MIKADGLSKIFDKLEDNMEKKRTFSFKGRELSNMSHLIYDCREFWKKNKGNYFEIGCFDGVTLCKIATELPSAVCYGIDPFLGDHHVPQPKNPVMHKNGLVELPQQRINLTENIKIFENVVFFETTSEEFMDSLTEDKIEEYNISICYIDGAHIYDYIIIDWKLSLMLIGKNPGMILFDDTNIDDVERSINDLELYLKKEGIDYKRINPWQQGYNSSITKFLINISCDSCYR
jgi:hypothetical protein